MDNRQVRILLDKYVMGTISAGESEELFRLIQAEEYSPLFEAYIDEYFASVEPEETGSLQVFDSIKSKLSLAIAKQPARVRRLNPLRRIAAAASIVLVIGIGTYFLFFNKNAESIDVAKTNVIDDVKPPETNRAMITLANGQKVFLDSAGNGQLAMEQGVNLIKLADGKIVYDDSRLATDNPQLTFNTLSNPRGSKVIDMLLADGSHVWLNAGSSITFPVAFVENERKVTIKGEAYFEVAHDATKKFIVEANGATTEVLGTHFNVNAYEDEENIKVTLLQGSVKTSMVNGQSAILKAGEQVKVDRTNQSPVIIHSPDLDEVMAWKNGRFVFNDADLKDIMRQLARWYDLEVIYTKDVKEKFYVEMASNTNLSNVIKILEETGGVHFKIDGKKIMVMP
jgi:transmembrane sensor